MQGFCVNDKLKANYDNYYNGESEWRRLGAITKVNNIIALCNKYPHKTLLEIGSGEGSILNRLSELQFGDSLYSLEISASAVEAIHKRNIKSLVECRLFDGYNIPYEDKHFDLAILSHVVEHLEYPRKILYEVSRVAHYIFVEVPLEHNARLKRDYIFDTLGHINFYSPKTIRRLVQTCNLEVLSQIVTNPSYKEYTYRCGKRGAPKYLLKELTLLATPTIATSLWTYNCSLICKEKTA